MRNIYEGKLQMYHTIVKSNIIENILVINCYDFSHHFVKHFFSVYYSSVNSLGKKIICLKKMSFVFRIRLLNDLNYFT